MTSRLRPRLSVVTNSHSAFGSITWKGVGRELNGFPRLAGDIRMFWQNIGHDLHFVSLTSSIQAGDWVYARLSRISRKPPNMMETNRLRMMAKLNAVSGGPGRNARKDVRSCPRNSAIDR